MRSFAVVGLSAMVAGCTLLVSTSDLSGGTPASGAPDSSDSTHRDSGAVPAPEGGSTAEAGRGELPGLVGKWLFDDGTPNDSSGNGRQGQVEGDATIEMTDRGSAVRVQTKGHFTVDVLDAAAFQKSGTISVWFRYLSMARDIEQSIFDSWVDTREHIFVRHANGAAVGHMQIGFQKGANEYELATGFDVDVGRWAHVIVTWDAANTYGRAYVDGQSVLADNYPSGAFVPKGQLMDFGGNLDGYIDDVRLYDRPLTEVEISSLP